MKILKLLNKKFFSIVFFLLIGIKCVAEEKPVDIWNIDKEQMDENYSSESSIVLNESQIKTTSESTIYEMQ